MLNFSNQSVLVGPFELQAPPLPSPAFLGMFSAQAGTPAAYSNYIPTSKECEICARWRAGSSDVPLTRVALTQSHTPHARPGFVLYASEILLDLSMLGTRRGGGQGQYGATSGLRVWSGGTRDARALHGSAHCRQVMVAVDALGGDSGMGPMFRPGLGPCHFLDPLGTGRRGTHSGR